MISEFEKIKITGIEIDASLIPDLVSMDAEGNLLRHPNTALKPIADAWPIGGLNVRGYGTNVPILGIYYTAPPETVTMEAAPTTANWLRRDTVAVNTLNRIVILPGTPGLVGAAPVVDLNLYFPIRDLVLLANATEPVDPITLTGNSNEFVLFAETGTVAGGEANVSGSAASIAVTANTQIAGAKSIEATNVQKLHEARFEYLELKSTVGQTHFIYKLKLKAAVQTSKYWFFRLYNGTTTIGNFLFKHGQYGFNANDLGVQYLSIPIEVTPFKNVSYTKATLFFYHGATTIPGYYLDDVKFLNSLPTIIYADQVQSDWDELDQNKVTYIKGRFDQTLKVDKIPGKDLSTNDFTTIEKETLAKFTVPLTQDLIPVSQLDGSIVWQTAPEGGASQAPVHLRYTTQALMIAGQANQLANYVYFDGTYYYEYLGTVLGTIADYRRVGGDMTLAGIETVTGAKYFLNAKLLMRNVANTFSSYFTNTNTAERIYTLPNKAGTVAMTSDIVAQLNGTINYLVKFGTATTGVVSRLWDTGTYLGIGTVNSPLKDITLGSQANREIGIELSDSNTIGRDLIISAGKTINYTLNTNFAIASSVIQVWEDITVDRNNGDVWACFDNGGIYKQTGGTGEFVLMLSTQGYTRAICIAPNGDFYKLVYPGNGIYVRIGNVGGFVAVGVDAWVGAGQGGLTACNNGDIYMTTTGASGAIYKRTAGTGNFINQNQLSASYTDIKADPISNDVYAVGNSVLFKQTGGVGNFVSVTVPVQSYSKIALLNNNNTYLFTSNNTYVQYNKSGGWTTLNQNLNIVDGGVFAHQNGNIYVASYGYGRIYMQNNQSIGAIDLDGGTLKLKAGTGKGTGKSRYQIVTGQKTVSGTDMQIETVRAEFDEEGNYKRIGTPVYADNASALAGGLTAGMEYRTATGIKMEVY